MGSFSNSLPIKWYLNGTPTFNEDKPVGIIKKKYSQKFNRSSRITSQYMDANELGLQLIIKDEDGNEVKTINAAKEQLNGVWFYSWDFSFEEQGLGEGCYTLEVYSNSTTGDGAVIIPSLIIAGDGSQSTYIEITGDGAVILLSLIVGSDGLNYPYNSANCRLGAETSEVCLAGVQVLYYSEAFGPGTTMYIDKDFSATPAGYNYIKNDDYGPSIFVFDDITGQVGVDTGLDC